MIGKKGKNSCKIDNLITKFKSCTRKICISMYTENSKWLYAKIVIQYQEPMMGPSQCIFLMRIKPLLSIGFSGLNSAYRRCLGFGYVYSYLRKKI